MPNFVPSQADLSLGTRTNGDHVTLFYKQSGAGRGNQGDDLGSEVNRFLRAELFSQKFFSQRVVRHPICLTRSIVR